MLDVDKGPQEQRHLLAETTSRILLRFASPPYDGTTEAVQCATSSGSYSYGSE